MRVAPFLSSPLSSPLLSLTCAAAARAATVAMAWAWACWAWLCCWAAIMANRGLGAAGAACVFVWGGGQRKHEKKRAPSG